MNVYKVTGTYRNVDRATLYSEAHVIVAKSLPEAVEAFGDVVTWGPSRHVEVRTVQLLHEFATVVPRNVPSSLTEMLAAFHEALGDEPGRGNAGLRITLQNEEHDELIEALEEGDRAHIARELADVVYIAFGTAHAFAIDLDAALAEIHRAAMSKLVGPGLPIVREDGKILKPPGFVPPDMTAAVAQEGNDA